MKLTKKEWLLRAGREMGLGLCLMGIVLAWMANAQTVNTTTVQGTVYLANGKAAAGTLVVSWPAFTTANGQAVVADSMTVPIAPDGFVSVNLAPNLGATPAGLYYTAVFYLSDGTVNTEYWVVPAAAQASLGAVQAQVMPAAQAIHAVNKAYVDQSIAELNQSLLTASGGTMDGPLYLSGDPTQPLQATDKHYVDESLALAVPLTGGNMTGALTGPSMTATQLGGTYQVDQFPGVDLGAKLQACLGTVSASYGGTCDARNFTGTQQMGSNLTIATANATVLLPCATISTANQVIVTAGTRNVTLRGCALRGASTASGSQGGTVFLYSGTGALVQVGDPTYAADTMGFHMDNAVINTTAASSAKAQGLAAYRTQEMDLENLYFLGNSNQTGMTLDGTGNYTGGTFFDDAFNGFQTAVNAIGHQISNPATTDWMNASTFVRLHIDCPTSNSNPISGTYGINLQQGDGNTFTGGDVEGCATALHLGANAQNNTIVGLRNENSNSQVVADAGSSYNNWMSGGTMFAGQLTDNGTRNSFLDTFHRSFNGMNGDWYGSQKDATVTNHYRIGIGAGNERGLLNRYQTDYGYRWTMGLSDATGGEQFYQVLDELNNVYRLSIGQYNNGQPSANNQTVINAAGTGAVVLNGSSNSGTGGVIIGSGGTSETTVATISSQGNAQFNGSLQVGGASTFNSTPTVKNLLDAEIDATLWAGLTMSQKESFIYKDWNGSSQWYMEKDQNNNWELNSATGGLDSIKAYQSTNSGDTYINASNSSGVVRVNYEPGAGSGFKIYGGGSSAPLYASFTGTTSIMFPGLAASSGHDCLQVDNSGYITNTGSACGSSSGGSGTIGSGNSGQIAYYTASGTAIGGMNMVPITAGGTGAATTAGALANIGGAALTGAAFSGAITAPSINGKQTVPPGGDIQAALTAEIGGGGTVDLTPGQIYVVTPSVLSNPALTFSPTVYGASLIFNFNGACIETMGTGDGLYIGPWAANVVINNPCFIPGAKSSGASIHDASTAFGVTINHPIWKQAPVNYYLGYASPLSTSTPFAVVSGGTGCTNGTQQVTGFNGGGFGAIGTVTVAGGVPTGNVTVTTGWGGAARNWGYTSVPTSAQVATCTGTTTLSGGALQYTVQYWNYGIQVDQDELFAVNNANGPYAVLRCDTGFCGSGIYGAALTSAITSIVNNAGVYTFTLPTGQLTQLNIGGQTVSAYGTSGGTGSFNGFYTNIQITSDTTFTATAGSGVTGTGTATGGTVHSYYNAAVGNINESQLSMECANPIDWQGGGDLTLKGDILQGYSQYGLRVGKSGGGSSGKITMTGIHNEAGGYCTNPALNGITGNAGFIFNGAGISAKLSDGRGGGGIVPNFPNSDGLLTDGTEVYNYFVVIHQAGGAPTTQPLPVGNTTVAAATLGGSYGVVVTAPASTGIGDTCDFLRIDLGISGRVAPYTGLGNMAIPGEQGVPCGPSSGTYISFTDTTPTSGLSAYTVNTTNPYFASLLNWPGFVVLSGDTYSDRATFEGQCGIASTFVVPGFQTSNGQAANITCEGATEDAYQGAVTPYGPSVQSKTNGYNWQNRLPSALLLPLWTLTASTVNVKGALNFATQGSSNYGGGATDIITLIDSNRYKTLSIAGNRPTADAGDTAIGVDQTYNGLAERDPTSISWYINQLSDNASYVARLTATTALFKQATFTLSGLSGLPSSGNYCLHIGSTGNVTPTTADCSAGSVTATGSPASGSIAAFSGSASITNATAAQLGSLTTTWFNSLTGCGTAHLPYVPYSGTCESLSLTWAGGSVSSASTFTANGSASAPAVSLTGAPYTGGTTTTNFPLLYLNDGTGPTTLSSNGTEFGINAPSGFTGNLIDAHVNGGGSVFKVDYTGAVTSGNLSSSGGITASYNSAVAMYINGGNGGLTITNGGTPTNGIQLNNNYAATSSTCYNPAPITLRGNGWHGGASTSYAVTDQVICATGTDGTITETKSMAGLTGTYNYVVQGNVGTNLLLPNTIYSAAGTALPTCASGIKGAQAVVSDATSPTYMGTYTSGGAITAAVICSYNGTTYSWLTR